MAAAPSAGFQDARLHDPALVREIQEQVIALASLSGVSMMLDLEAKTFMHIPTTLVPTKVRCLGATPAV